MTEFDEQTEKYLTHLDTPRYRYLEKRVNKTIKSFDLNGKNVLEVGCGASRFLINISNCKKYGLDLSKELLKRNPKESATFVQGNALECSKLFDIKFDFIFIVNLVHHINENEHRKLLQEVKKILKDNGNILIVEPNMISITGIYYVTKKLLLKVVGKNILNKIVNFIDEDEKYLIHWKFKKLAKENGFIVESDSFQYLRLPPIRLINKINIDWINYPLDFMFGWLMLGTRLIYILRKE